jgi:hypothetical protein
MPDMRDIVDAVKNFVPIFLIEELSLGIENFQRVLSVVCCQHGVESLLSLFHNAINLLLVPLFIRFKIFLVHLLEFYCLFFFNAVPIDGVGESTRKQVFNLPDNAVCGILLHMNI